MATSTIKAAYQALTALTITLDSLGNGTARQSTRVTQTSPAEMFVEISGELKTGTTPGSSKFCEIYFIRRDGNATANADDAAGASDAAITIANAQLLASIPMSSSDNTVTRFGPIVVPNPGLDFVVAVKNGTSANLNASSGASNLLYYRLFSAQGQAT